MVSPKTYRGYDEEGKQVCSCTAVDANGYINPDEVKAAIDNVESVVSEQMNNISKALSNVAPEAEEAVIVQGTKMTETIEEICSSLGSLSGTFADSISSLYTESVRAHDEIQTQANDDAYNAVASSSGVVRVSG